MADPNDPRKSAYSVSSPTSYSTPYDNANAAQSPFSDNNRYSAAPSSTQTIPSTYATAPTAPSIPAPRQSMDVYGAFSDPAPSGFGAAPQLPQPNFGRPLSPPVESPRVSRTMQYADPYAAIRATVASGQTNPNQGSGYSGYR